MCFGPRNVIVAMVGATSGTQVEQERSSVADAWLLASPRPLQFPDNKCSALPQRRLGTTKELMNFIGTQMMKDVGEQDNVISLTPVGGHHIAFDVPDDVVYVF